MTTRISLRSCQSKQGLAHGRTSNYLATAFGARHPAKKAFLHLMSLFLLEEEIRKATSPPTDNNPIFAFIFDMIP